MPIRVALKAGPKVGEKTEPRKGRQGITEKSPKMGPKSKTKRPEMMGGGLMAATERLKRQGKKTGGMTKAKGAGMGAYSSVKDPKVIKNLLKIPLKAKTKEGRVKKMGGGMMQMPRAMYGKGGGVCKRGMGRAYGKNS